MRVAGVILAAMLPIAAQELYPFGIDQDTLHGAPDFSFLNHPLTGADRVTVKNGHFYTASGRRTRLYGVNLAFGANFPTQADSVRIARRLRRLGVNLVRLHHMDSSPDAASNPGAANSLLTTGPYPSFNEVSVQRLRDLLTALAAEGIYADLNLHVGYQFRPGVDGVPVVAGQAMPDQSKPLHIFYPRMVELQQEYAQQAIAKLRLKGDPVLAMVEINNESSLVQAWQWGQLDPVLTGEYRSTLQTQWNRWLAAKYANTEALGRAWGTSGTDGPNLLSGKWTLEQGHGKSGTLTMTTADGLPTAQVQPGQGSGWLFLKQTGFQMAAGVRYVWTFEARTDAGAGQKVNAPVSVMRDVSPWDGFLYSSITLANDWQTFTIPVTGSFAINDSGRVSLDVEYAPGNVYARKMSLVQAGLRGLATGESIEAANVSLLGPGEGATAARMNDYVSFLIATDRSYVETLRDTVRAATDSLVPLTGTQIGYGGLAIFDSQDGLDYQDNHFYIDHYSFPGVAWDAQDWRIRDAAASDDGWSAFADMAWGREAGRPYTVSEFNQPWPNTHGAELDPTLAAFAAFQDWDAIMHFAYSHGRGWDDGVPNGFNINGDWTKFPMIGQSAWMFRTGAVRASGAPLVIPVSPAQRLQATAMNQTPAGWVAAVAGMPKEMAFLRGVQLGKDGPFGAGSGSNPGNPATPYISDTGELTFDPAGKLALVHASGAAGVFGNAGKNPVTAGAIDVELGERTRGFASVLLTALDGTALARSGRMLLTIPGYSLRALPAAGNRAPSAANAQPQMLVHYPGTTDWWTVDATNGPQAGKPSGDMNGGWQPTYMERVEAWVTLRTHASSVAVYALDGAGNVAGVLPTAEVQAVAGGFRIHLNGVGEVAAPWFLVEAVQVRHRVTR